MPELPEVEAAVRELRAAIVARAVARVRRLHPTIVRALPDADADALLGRRVVAVERRGKHQLLRLDDGTVLHAHFRMSGDWCVGRAGETPRHARAVLDLDDGSAVALVDPRALATLALRRADADPALGPEATDPAFDADALGRALARRRGPIKPALLDQRVVAGLGNIYAAEALWRARISPRAAASALGPARRARLVDAIRETLREALAAPARYSSGEGADAMRVYGREGEPCARCGAAIRRVVQAGRSTYYCPRCQAR
jgi:formamidopyrimidine-DNA glycosylase